MDTIYWKNTVTYYLIGDPSNFCLVFLLCKMLYFKNDFELEEKLVSDTRKKKMEGPKWSLIET